jgi:hypothetical protein
MIYSNSVCQKKHWYWNLVLTGKGYYYRLHCWFKIGDIQQSSCSYLQNQQRCCPLLEPVTWLGQGTASHRNRSWWGHYPLSFKELVPYPIKLSRFLHFRLSWFCFSKPMKRINFTHQNSMSNLGLGLSHGMIPARTHIHSRCRKHYRDAGTGECLISG